MPIKQARNNKRICFLLVHQAVSNLNTREIPLFGQEQTPKFGPSLLASQERQPDRLHVRQLIGHFKHS